MGDLRDILLSRQQGKSDSHRIGLCLDSGGMKGAAVGGMAAALDDLGLLSCFDDVYGSSCGALIGAYALAGNRASGAEIFWEHLSDGRFIRPVMTPIGGAMHMNYLFDCVLQKREPLDVKAIAACGIKFHPLVTNRSFGVRDGRELFDLESPLGMMTALRAAVRVPLVCGNPWSQVPDLWTDAGLAEPIPYQTPKSQGITHMLMLRSAPKLYRPSGALELTHSLAKWLLAKPITGSVEAGRHIQEHLLDRQPRSCLQQIYPASGPKYSFFCRDRQTLMDYAEAGRSSVLAWWEAPAAPAGEFGW